MISNIKFINIMTLLLKIINLHISMKIINIC